MDKGIIDFFIMEIIIYCILNNLENQSELILSISIRMV